jgi:hypothetical protein
VSIYTPALLIVQLQQTNGLFSGSVQCVR